LTQSKQRIIYPSGDRESRRGRNPLLLANALTILVLVVLQQDRQKSYKSVGRKLERVCSEKAKEGLQVTNFKIGGFEMLKLRFGRSLIEYEMVFLWYLQKSKRSRLSYKQSLTLPRSDLYDFR